MCAQQEARLLPELWDRHAGGDVARLLPRSLCRKKASACRTGKGPVRCPGHGSILGRDSAALKPRDRASSESAAVSAGLMVARPVHSKVAWDKSVRRPARRAAAFGESRLHCKAFDVTMP